MFFLEKSDQGHHSNKEKDDVKTREFNYVGDINEIGREENRDATEGEGQTKLPVKEGPADDG